MGLGLNDEERFPLLWTSKRRKIFYPTKSSSRESSKKGRLCSRARPFRTELMLGIPNIYKALSLGPNNSTKLFGSCLFTYKSWRWHPPCHTVSFVSKIQACSNTPLGPRRWNHRSTYEGMVVACSHQNHGLWPHRRNTVYVVAVCPTGCCSQDI